jgi:hypothetical protein
LTTGASGLYAIGGFGSVGVTGAGNLGVTTPLSGGCPTFNFLGLYASAMLHVP